MRIDHFNRRGIIRVFGSWAVTKLGVENLSGPCIYEIDREALADPGWSSHMAEKSWVIQADFDAALAFAREFFDIKVAGPVDPGEWLEREQDQANRTHQILDAIRDFQAGWGRHRRQTCPEPEPTLFDQTLAGFLG